MIFSIEQYVQNQRRQEGPKSEIFAPLAHPVNPKPHTAIYKMHRYFARRPWNVFEQIIKHYTEAGQIVLDPFCGGGVTVVESLKLRRKVIGADLNPIANFITQMQVLPIDLSKLDIAFETVSEAVKAKINELYQTKCRKCGSEAALASWFEYSKVFLCPHCGTEVIAAKAEKSHGGTYQCPNCQQKVTASAAKRLPDQLVRLAYACPSPTCGKTEEAAADNADIARAKQLDQAFEALVAQENLWYPLDEFPECDRERDDALREKGITHFYKMFTKRNLLANARLFQAIQQVEAEPALKEMLHFAFTARLPWTSTMTSSTGHGWQHHGFWMPNVHYEMNVWRMFQQGYSEGQSTLKRGKEQSNREIGNFCVFASTFEALRTDDATCLLLNQSSHKLPLPDQSVDAIITDPPFGGNVQYAELSNFWWVWRGKGLIETNFEAVQSRHTGFPTAKSAEHYEEMLYQIFREGHRVLKKDGWLVMTFHNRDLKVWMALHRAARRAGFRLPSAEESPNRGMIYQPPIEEYTTTLHQRAKGSMLGDFVLSFKRENIAPNIEGLLTALSTQQETQLQKYIELFLTYQGGADENAIMTALIPYLGEMNLLHRIANLDFTGFLKKYFHYDKKEGRWYTSNQVVSSHDQKGVVVRPLDHIQAEEIVASLIRSYLGEHQRATMDDLLILIYSQLVNSHRPGIGTISKVLDQICEMKEMEVTNASKGKKSKSFFVLKAEQAKENDSKGIKLTFLNVNDNLSHNDLIQLLCDHSFALGYTVHVGQTEQRKVKGFRGISVKMQDRTSYGIPVETAFKTIKEIDLLCLRDNVIIAAFEITTTISTANKAINDRYRNLFAVLPNLNIKCFVVVEDKDVQKASDILNMEANKRDGVSRKVQIIKKSDVSLERFKRCLE